MAGMFGLKCSNRLGKYLRVYIDDHKDMNKKFQCLIDKVQSRLARWKGKLLSQVGRLTLIKSRLQSDFMYSLSSICFTNSQLDKLNQTAVNFFWGNNVTNHPKVRLHSAAVHQLPKHLGALVSRMLGR